MTRPRSRSRARPEPLWVGFRALRVTNVVPETTTVSSIYLAAVDGSRLPAARGGQYLTLRIAGAGQPAPVRTYSLSSAPDTGTYRISVKREPNGIASTYLNRKLQAGATLEAAAPRGDFVLDDATTPVLLISGGIGVTPVLSMLHQLAAQRSERDTWWIHGARRPREHALAAEAHTLLASLPNAHEHLFYSDATPTECRRAHATAGRVTRDELSRLVVPADASAYICGPPGFMADVQDALIAVGVDSSRIHTELFGALSSINPGLIGETPPSTPPTRWPTGNRTPRHLRAQRHRHAVRHRHDERARARRGMRRQHPMELPNRRLSHLHHTASHRRRLLRAGAAGAASRG